MKKSDGVLLIRAVIRIAAVSRSGREEFPDQRKTGRTDGTDTFPWEVGCGEFAMSRLLLLKSFWVTLSLAVVISGCTKVGDAVPQPKSLQQSGLMTDPTILQHLSPMLSPSEALIMYNAMAALPERARQNVILWDQNGVEHSNDPQMLAASVPQVVDVISSERESPQSEPSLPACNASSDPGECTGVLYKHKGPNGFSFLGTTINVPCASTIINTTTTNYQGNFYISVGSSSTSPAQLEMGVQFNANGSSPVMSIQPYYSADGTHGSFSGNPHLTCDQSSLILEAYVFQASSSAPAYGTLILNGGFSQAYGPSPCGTGASCTTTLTTMKALLTSDNLTQVCPGCHVEWTTAVAVPAGGNQILKGSTFGIKSCAPTLTWKSVVEGYFSSAGPSAAASASPWSSTTILQSPSSATSLGLITTKDNGLANETIGVNESSGCLSGTVQ